MKKVPDGGMEEEGVRELVVVRLLIVVVESHARACVIVILLEGVDGGKSAQLSSV